MSNVLITAYEVLLDTATGEAQANIKQQSNVLQLKQIKTQIAHGSLADIDELCDKIIDGLVTESIKNTPNYTEPTKDLFYPAMRNTEGVLRWDDNLLTLDCADIEWTVIYGYEEYKETTLSENTESKQVNLDADMNENEIKSFVERQAMEHAALQTKLRACVVAIPHTETIANEINIGHTPQAAAIPWNSKSSEVDPLKDMEIPQTPDASEYDHVTDTELCTFVDRVLAESPMPDNITMDEKSHVVMSMRTLITKRDILSECVKDTVLSELVGVMNVEQMLEGAIEVYYQRGLQNFKR